MHVRSGDASWRYLLRPSRYDFEVARDWRDFPFQLYGLNSDRQLARRMGGKSATVRGSSCLARLIPEEFRRSLSGLEVIEEGDGWHARITSQGGTKLVPELAAEFNRRRSERRYLGPRSPNGDGWARSCEINVDGEPWLFEGWQTADVWAGQFAATDVLISVVADGIDPESLALSQITDPSPYLQGQREFMKRRP